MLPNLATAPVIAVSKDRCNDRFSSARVLKEYFPENKKYVVVPRDQCKSYRPYLAKANPEFQVLPEPSKGLAAADAYITRADFLGLDKIEVPFVIKAVDDMVSIKLARVDAEGNNSVVKCSRQELHDVLKAMMSACWMYGGLLAGFCSSDPRNCVLH